MPKDSAYFKQLLQLYLENKCTPIQLQELFTLLNKDQSNRMLLEIMQAEFSTSLADLNEGANKNEKAEASIIVTAKVLPLYKRKWIQVAAAIIFILAGTVLYYKIGDKENTANQLSENSSPIQAILPGEDKAVLILGNGEKIILDSSLRGTIALQGNAVISKNKTGQIIYDASGAINNNDDVVYNTVKTPKGGFFKVVLPDGSEVWLNASSSIYFPTRFTGNERKVTISGEAYFEVVKNQAKPFKVSFYDETIEVLGTHFNVMAYDDEPNIQTTLLEGAIKISNGKGTVFVKPGQQAISEKNKKIELINGVNTDHIVAWKNGLFDFDNDSLPFIMRQLSRWYNVDILYQEKYSNGHYVGSIRKQSNIREVLKMLELAGDVQFSIVGNKILVK